MIDVFDNKEGEGIVIQDGNIEMKVFLKDIIPLTEKLLRAYLRLKKEG